MLYNHDVCVCVFVSTHKKNMCVRWRKKLHFTKYTACVSRSILPKNVQRQVCRICIYGSLTSCIYLRKPYFCTAQPLVIRTHATTYIRSLNMPSLRNCAFFDLRAYYNANQRTKYVYLWFMRTWKLHLNALTAIDPIPNDRYHSTLLLQWPCGGVRALPPLEERTVRDSLSKGSPLGGGKAVASSVWASGTTPPVSAWPLPAILAILLESAHVWVSVTRRASAVRLDSFWVPDHFKIHAIWGSLKKRKEKLWSFFKFLMIWLWFWRWNCLSLTFAGLCFFTVLLNNRSLPTFSWRCSICPSSTSWTSQTWRWRSALIQTVYTSLTKRRTWVASCVSQEVTGDMQPYS